MKPAFCCKCSQNILNCVRFISKNVHYLVFLRFKGSWQGSRNKPTNPAESKLRCLFLMRTRTCQIRTKTQHKNHKLAKGCLSQAERRFFVNTRLPNKKDPAQTPAQINHNRPTHILFSVHTGGLRIFRKNYPHFLRLLQLN